MGGVALVKDGEVLAETLLAVRALHSEVLLPAVSELMDSSGVKGTELSGIGVSLGPGSYTGLRIGIATALGLSTGWGVPLKGVSTLRVIAAGMGGGPVLSCIKARNGEVFAGSFQSPDPSSPEIVPQGLYTSKKLLELSAGIDYIAVGSGRTELSPRDNLKWASVHLDSPKPSMAALCASLTSDREGFDEKIEPLYLRSFNQRISDQ